MIGENPEELWLIQLSELRTTLLQKSSAVMDIPMIVIGGVLVLSCLNVRLDGHLSVLKRLMIHIERLSTGAKPFISRKMFSLDLKQRILFEGTSFTLLMDETQLILSSVSSATRKTALGEYQLMRSKLIPSSAVYHLIHSGVSALPSSPG